MKERKHRKAPIYPTLAAYRTTMNINQYEMAEEIKMSASNYGKKENDIVKFRVDEMILITNIIKKEFPNATMDMIFQRSDNESN